MKCVAGELGRVDNDYMTFSVKEEGEMSARVGLGSQGTLYEGKRRL